MHLDLQNIRASFRGLSLLGGCSEVFENQKQKFSSPDFLHRVELLLRVAAFGLELIFKHNQTNVSTNPFIWCCV